MLPVSEANSPTGISCAARAARGQAETEGGDARQAAGRNGFGIGMGCFKVLRRPIATASGGISLHKAAFRRRRDPRWRRTRWRGSRPETRSGSHDEDFRQLSASGRRARTVASVLRRSARRTGRPCRRLQHPYWTDAGHRRTRRAHAAGGIDDRRARSRRARSSRSDATTTPTPPNAAHDAPTSPLTWLMAPSSLLAHERRDRTAVPGAPGRFRGGAGHRHRARGENVSAADAEDYIFGYTTCQDISDRDIQDSEKQFARAKCFDTFTPRRAVRVQRRQRRTICRSRCTRTATCGRTAARAR